MANDDGWPVKATAQLTGLGGYGDSSYAPSPEPFAASQTKYLRIQLSNSVGVGTEVGSSFVTDATLNYNGDPLAPPLSMLGRDVVNNPFATASNNQDGLSAGSSVETRDMWQGLKFQSPGSSVYYTSLNFWALQPGFVQEPSWSPNQGEDPHWGTLQYTTTPGYVAVQQAGFGLAGSSGQYVDASGMPNMPYVIGGSYGSFQTSRPSGPCVPAYEWSSKIWKTGYWGIAEFDNSGTDTGADVTCSDVAADGQWHYTGYVYYQGQYYDNYEQVTPGYLPINGSYDQVTAASGHYNYPKNGAPKWYWDSATYTYHELVYNPGPGTITFSQSQARENGDTYYCAYFDVGSAGTVQISPGQYAWLTSTYTMPQSTYTVYLGGFQDVTGPIAPSAFWTYYNNGSGNAYTLHSDFGVGCCAPASRLNVFSASPILNQCVDYDWGIYDTHGTEYSVSSSNANPGVIGSGVWYAPTMTPSEVYSVLGYNSKTSAIVGGASYASWSAQVKLFSVKQDGWYSYVTAS